MKNSIVKADSRDIVVDTLVSDLTVEFNARRKKLLGAEKTTLAELIRLGEILKALKDRLGHNHWLPWLHENLHVSGRQASKYMRVFKYREKIQDAANRSRRADLLSLAEALRLMTGFKPKRGRRHRRLKVDLDDLRGSAQNIYTYLFTHDRPGWWMLTSEFTRLDRDRPPIYTVPPPITDDDDDAYNDQISDADADTFDMNQPLWAVILGVEVPCSEAEIKAAYHSACKSCHPDVGGSAAAFVKIDAAYRAAMKYIANIDI